jgi:hypothetical protein
MTSTTGKQAAAAAAKTLLADRIALVETLGAALDTHRRAEQAVTTDRTTANRCSTKARPQLGTIEGRRPRERGSRSHLLAAPAAPVGAAKPRWPGSSAFSR